MFLALPGLALAEPPAAPPEKPALKVPPPRTKPQVIYRLPSSNYAATLHSQAKGGTTDLPVDSSMPTSLQLSRSNANAAAARAREEASPPPEEQAVKGPKVRSNRPMRPPGKAKGPGRSHGKGHKK